MIELITSWLTTVGWRDWAAVIGAILGLVTLKAYIDQRRGNRQQEDIISFVKRHLDKEISEEAIERLEAQRQAMEDQVPIHIPALARAAVLNEQAQIHATAIATHYAEWQRIRNELAESPTKGSIDPGIESIIVDRIVPSFEKERRLESIRNEIVLLSVALVLFNSISRLVLT